MLGGRGTFGGGGGLRYFREKNTHKKKPGKLLLCSCTPHYIRWERGPVTTQAE